MERLITTSTTAIPPPGNDPGKNSSTSSQKRKSRKSDVNANGRPIKRRASKACQCCRARKVRCNVVEQGVPCANCKVAAITCVVPECKRAKKRSNRTLKQGVDGDLGRPHSSDVQRSVSMASSNDSSNPILIPSPNLYYSSPSTSSSSDEDENKDETFDVLHPLFSDQTRMGQSIDFDDIFHSVGFTGDLRAARLQTSAPQTIIAPDSTAVAPQCQSNGILPAYIQPLPTHMEAEDMTHLWRKGATTIPDTAFRNALLQSFTEFVYPYLPMLELHDFLRIVDKGNGECGRVSLLLFQAVLFAGVAFVDGSYLTAAGFATRREARKSFYLKARALYDFDYEPDGVVTVQALLLMTYWLEAPDNQKNTWHWIGVAISSANTIGLHCNPVNSTTDVKKQKLWKRIWWSCLMRDRLAALGMRKAPRIKDEDYDVPMLTLDDFEIQPLAADNTTLSPDCRMIRDVAMQRDLAMICITQAKLCLHIGHVLSTQYSVLMSDEGTRLRSGGKARPHAILIPKKHDETEEVGIYDSELADWYQSLPPACLYSDPSLEDIERGASTVVVQRTLTHMCYYTTLAALHRPHVLKRGDQHDGSRAKVYEASREITRMSQSLHKLELTRYLSTSGLTVILPAITMHLVRIKSPNEVVRNEAIKGFCQCIQVLEKLRDNYAIIDFETQFLDIAVYRAGIDANTHLVTPTSTTTTTTTTTTAAAAKPTQNHLLVQRPKQIVQSVSQLVAAGLAARLTPPPDSEQSYSAAAPDHNSAPIDGFGNEPFAFSPSGINNLLSFPSNSPPNPAYAYPNDENNDYDNDNDNGGGGGGNYGDDDDVVNFSQMRAEIQERYEGDTGFEELLDALIDFEGNNAFTASEWWVGGGVGLGGSVSDLYKSADLLIVK